MRKGVFITFEGPEKSGKSTQAKLLCRHLKRLGYDALFLREPGSTRIGEKVRRLLLDKKHDKMTSATEMLLYMAARGQLVEEIIKPALKAGRVVLCDRFMDSTLAYQGYGLGFDQAVIRKVGSVATGGLKPDLTLLLDFWGSRSFLRNSRAQDRIESRSDAFHRRVKRGYFAMHKAEPRRIKVITVQAAINETQVLIRREVLKCLSRTS